MNIVLGVSGGIAAYKAVSLARLFVEAGHELHVVPTTDALRFVGLPTWEAISRNPVTTSVHDGVHEVRHVALGQRADLIVIAPATAHTLAKMTTGLADDLLGTTLLASTAPVLVAPAMHSEMWQHAATQHNVEILRKRGVHLIGPEHGRLTGNDSGPGRMSEPEAIFSAALSILHTTESPSGAEHPPLDLAGVRLLVSAGGTREPLDPVRFLGNRSSGRQGVAIAAAAAARGATVTLVAAHIESGVLATASAARVRSVGSAADLEAVMQEEQESAEVIVMAAAVADYRPRTVSAGKLRKEDAAGSARTIELIENPDVLQGLVQRRTRSGQVIVGFAAETVQSHEELIERGRRKLARKGCDLLAVNAVGWEQGFESTDNELTILGADGSVRHSVSGSKAATAHAVLDAVVAALAEG